MAQSRQLCMLSLRRSLDYWPSGLIRSPTGCGKAHSGAHQATRTRHPRRFYSTETEAAGAAAVESPRQLLPQTISLLKRSTAIGASLRRSRLSKMERHQQFFEHICGPPSAAEQQIAVELDKPAVSARDVLLRCIANEEATVRVVYFCISTRWKQIKSLPRRTRPDLRSEILSEKLGTHALHHILRDLNLWLVFATAGLGMLLPLCYLVIIEGNERALRTWLDVGVDVPQLHGCNEHNWRGKIFGGLVGAHAHLDTTLCADPILKCLFEVMAALGTRDSLVKAEPSGRGFTALDCAAALTITKQNLCDPRNPRGWYNTDPELYEKFTALIARRQDPIANAQLDLYHPTAPSEQQVMALARDYMTAGSRSKIYDKFRETHKARAMRSIRHIFERAAQVAENNENSAGADWLRREVLTQFDRDTSTARDQSRPSEDSNSGTVSLLRKVPLPQFR